MTAHKKILLTGASGFVATHTLDILLKRGYTVKATFRSQDKADYISNKFKGKPVETVIVEDIAKPNAFDETFKNDSEITAVLHTASPFFSAKSDPVKELLDPAIKGTRNVLESIKKYAPQVTTLVVTSSYAAILHVSKRDDHSFIQNEETWSDVTWEQAVENLDVSYLGSKKFAEQEVWKFIEQEKPNFTATTVNPPLIFGPLLQDVKTPEELNTSDLILWKSIIESEAGDTGDKYTQATSPWIDVRDVALAHILPLENEKLAGKRLLIAGGYFSTQSLLDIVNKDFPALKGKIAIGKPGTGLKNLDKVSQLDNHVTNELLNLKYHTLEESIVDTFKSFEILQEK